jgi:WD40 repeat protein
MEGYKDGGIYLAFAPDGELLASWGWEGRLRFWNFRTGKQVLIYPKGGGAIFGTNGRCIFYSGRQLVMAEVATGREYRTLAPSEGFIRGGSSIHSGGRLLAVGVNQNLQFWDLESGDEIAAANQVHPHCIQFAGEELLVNSISAGFLSFPVRQESTPQPRLHIGPPSRFHRGANAAFASSKAGGTIALGLFPHLDAALIVRKAEGQEVRPLKTREPIGGTAISPDGRFATTFGHSALGETRIWDTTDARTVSALDTGGSVRGEFSPDGRWFAVNGSKLGRFIPVGAWEQGRPIEWNGGHAFSPDGGVFAMELGQGVISFVHSETGKVLARLEDPNQDKVDCLAFTPDGARLVGTSRDGRAIHVWDLGLIRTQLAAMRLDWDAPTFHNPYDASAKPRGKLVVEVDLSGFVQVLEAARLIEEARSLERKKDFAAALESLRRAVHADSENETAHNNLAWLLLAGPRDLRNDQEALPHARRAVELSAGNSHFLNTLGVALYRNGLYQDAIAALKKSYEENLAGLPPCDLFPLAACHHRLGDGAKAQEFYDRATRWLEKYRDRLDADEIAQATEFQTEAKAVLAEPAGTKKEEGS